MKQVPPGFVHFFIEGTEGDRVLMCMRKEEFKEKSVFNPNPKGFTDEKAELPEESR